MDGTRPATLLIEPFGGMAGDMFLAALLDLGDPRFGLAELRDLAESLVPGEAQLELERVWRRSLSGSHLRVVTPESAAPPHRHLKDLGALVARSTLGPRAADLTMAVLRRIAEAEGHVHGCSPDEVHFHEVGAVDTLIDVGGAALALERLGVGRVFSSPPLLGSGTVRCAHGVMPVPAPATAEILRGLPAQLSPGEPGGAGAPGAPLGERCTPTGAALLAELVAGAALPGGGFGGPPGTFTADAVGYGAGTRDPEAGPPNLLRVQLGSAEAGARPTGEPRHGRVLELGVTLDDMTPEEIGVLVAGLRRAGALEVWTAPVQMKKDRPGVVVTALAREADLGALQDAIFSGSSSFGVRWRMAERLEAGRAFETVELDGHAVRVKLRIRPGHDAPDPEVDAFCEHDDLARYAEAAGVPLHGARQRILAAFRRSRSPR